MRILCNNCKSFAVQCSVQTESLPRNADAAQKHSHNHIGNYTFVNYLMASNIVYILVCLMASNIVYILI